LLRNTELVKNMRLHFKWDAGTLILYRQQEPVIFLLPSLFLPTAAPGKFNCIRQNVMADALQVHGIYPGKRVSACQRGFHCNFFRYNNAP